METTFKINDFRRLTLQCLQKFGKLDFTMAFCSFGILFLHVDIVSFQFDCNMLLIELLVDALELLFFVFDKVLTFCEFSLKSTLLKSENFNLSL